MYTRGSMRGSDCDSFIVVDLYQISTRRHPIYDMPVLVRRHGEEEVLLVPVKV